jgi:hypothetical protein
MPWLSTLLVVILVPPLLLAMARGGQGSARLDGGRTWLEYGGALKGFAVGTLLLALAAVVASRFVDGDWAEDLPVVGLLLAVLGLPLFLEAFLVRLTFDDTFLICRSPWRPRREIPLRELGEPVYRKALQWWTLEAGEQGVVRLHDYLRGKQELFAAVHAAKEVD